MEGTIRFIKGKPHVEIIFREPIPISSKIPVSQDLDGEDCDHVRLSFGDREVERFMVNGKKYHTAMAERNDDPPPPPSGNPVAPAVLQGVARPRNVNCPNRQPAAAPYNFIPLQGKKEIVYAEPHLLDRENDLEYANLKSGYISLKITSKTPIFSRGKKAAFFTIDGTPTLAGSTIRGMVRSLVEIASYSKFSVGSMYEDKQYFHRNIRDDHYKDRILDVDASARVKYVKVKCKAGWLTKRDSKYFIQPAIKHDGNQIFRVAGDFINDRNGNRFETNRGVPCTLYRFTPLYFDPSATEHVHRTYVGRNEIPLDLEYNIIRAHSLVIQPGFVQGHLIASGPFAGIKHFQTVILGPDDSQKELSASEAIHIYDSDASREESIDLLNMLERDPSGVPCFYLDDGRQTILSLGHTPIYRLPYVFSTKDFVPLSAENGNVDLAESIFGRASNDEKQSILSGRVAFEDAPLVNGKIGQISLPKILSSPKPTSFQLYLKQDETCGYRTPKDAMTHWGTRDSSIRGFKNYWHRNDGSDWNSPVWENPNPEIPYDALATAIDEQNLNVSADRFIADSDCLSRVNGNGSVSITGDFQRLYQADDDFRKVMDSVFFPKSGKLKAQFQPIELLPRGSEFTGRIRFENLSEVELGALLFVLQLDDGLAQKIGMGKPIGLGSVRIEPTAYIIDRQKRYQCFIYDSKFETADRNLEPQEVKAIKDAFAAYVGKGIAKPGIATANDLWKEGRMKALCTMLTFTQAGIEPNAWLNRTEYGKIPGMNNVPQHAPNPFADRLILPEPKEVADANF